MSLSLKVERCNLIYSKGLEISSKNLETNFYSKGLETNFLKRILKEYLKKSCSKNKFAM